MGFAELDVAAVRERLDRPLAWWYGARLLDGRGRGVLAIDQVGRPAVPATTRWRVVHRGAGIFWTVDDHQLYLRSPGAVARTLRIPHLSLAYRAPISWLSSRRHLLRARLFLNAISLLLHRRPIAVITLAGLAGVNRRTIFRWLQCTHWGRITNAVLLQRLHGPDGPHVDRRSRDGRVLRIQHHTEIWLAARLPNSLTVERRPATKRGVLRRANAQLRSCDLRHRGERQQRYLMAGEHPPASPPQYQFHSQDKARLIQLWEPRRGSFERSGTSVF